MQLLLKVSIAKRLRKCEDIIIILSRTELLWHLRFAAASAAYAPVESLDNVKRVVRSGLDLVSMLSSRGRHAVSDQNENKAEG